MKMHKEKDGIDIPESARKRTPRVRKAQGGGGGGMMMQQQQKATDMSATEGLQVSVYEVHPHQQQQHQQIHLQQQHQQQETQHIIQQGGTQEVIHMQHQPRVQVQTAQQQHQQPQFAQVVLADGTPQHHQTVEIQIHGGEGGSMVIPTGRHGDDDMAAETVQQLVNLANMLPVSSQGNHVMHTMQSAHAQ